MTVTVNLDDVTAGDAYTFTYTPSEDGSVPTFTIAQ